MLSWATVYDTAGRAATQLGAAHTYDARGRLTGTTVLGSVATAYGTDLRGRTTSIAATRAGASVFSAAYTYAPNSLISVADWTQPLFPAGPQRCSAARP